MAHVVCLVHQKYEPTGPKGYHNHPLFVDARATAIDACSVVSVSSDTTRDFDSANKPTGVARSVYDVVSAITPIGILSIGDAFDSVGWVVGWFLLVVFACWANFGSALLLDCARLPREEQTGKSPTFYSIWTLRAKAIPFISQICSLAVGAAYGAAALVVVGDLITPVATAAFHEEFVSLYRSRVFWQFIAWVFTCIVVCFNGCGGTLRYLLATTSICIPVLVILLTVYAFSRQGTQWFDPCLGSPMGPECRGSTLVANRSAVVVLGNLPMFVFAFCGHYRLFTTFGHLESPTKASIDNTVRYAYGTACGSYIFFGLASYAVYGTNLAGDVFVNLPETNALAVLRVAFALHATLICCSSAGATKEEFTNLVCDVFSYFSSLSARTRQISVWCCSNFIVLLVIAGVSLLFPTLSDIYRVFGVWFAMPLMLVMPGLFYWSAYRKNLESNPSAIRFRFVLGIALSVCGGLLTVMCATCQCVVWLKTGTFTHT